MYVDNLSIQTYIKIHKSSSNLYTKKIPKANKNNNNNILEGVEHHQSANHQIMTAVDWTCLPSSPIAEIVHDYQVVVPITLQMYQT
jgi:hypothetical protein